VLDILLQTFSMNELDRISNAVRVYEGRTPSSHAVWLEAQRYLVRVHKTYGTIDVGSIREIIR